MGTGFTPAPIPFCHVHLPGCKHLQLAALVNDDLLGGGTIAAAKLLNLLDNVHAIGDLAEDDVLAIEPAGHDGGDEELGTIALQDRVSKGIGVRQFSELRVRTCWGLR